MPIYPPPDIGLIEVITGCMFSGKTEELVRRLKRAVVAKQPVCAFKPALDDRYAGEAIVSHGGVTLTAVPVKDAASILDSVGECSVVGIDEVHFFDDGLLDVTQQLAREGRRVICAGLDMDYRGTPFGVMPDLMAVAERVVKFHAICTVCQIPATRSQRIADSDEQVLVGGETVYEARCRAHWSPKPTFSARRQMDELED